MQGGRLESRPQVSRSEAKPSEDQTTRSEPQASEGGPLHGLAKGPARRRLEHLQTPARRRATCRCSAKPGRIPVGTSSTPELPSGVDAVPLEREDLLHATTSPSMPVISCRLTMRRRPSERRASCTTMWIAEAIWLRTARVRDVEARHRHHVLDPRQRVARRVGVDRRQRAVVAGVHRLQHVERLGAAHLADDDAVGAHAQRVDHEQSRCVTSPLPSMFGRPRLEPHRRAPA